MTENVCSLFDNLTKHNSRAYGYELNQSEIVQILKLFDSAKELEQYRAIGTIEEFKALKEKAEPKKVVYQDEEKERLVKSDEDCADCLCRVCARNSCNDSYNIQIEGGYANCSCNCNIGDKLIETEDDCPNFIPDEDQE